MSVSQPAAAALRHKPADVRQHGLNAKPRKRKILAAVGASEPTNRVVEYLMSLAASEPIEIVVLNVQAQPEDWRLRGYGSFKQDEIRDRLINDLGKPIVASVARKLDQAGIVHKDRIELGEPARTIIQCAEEENCDLVIIGEARHGKLRRWLVETAGIVFGSVASRLLQLTDIPILVVK